MIIHTVRAEFLYADGRTDRQTKGERETETCPS